MSNLIFASIFLFAGVLLSYFLSDVFNLRLLKRNKAIDGHTFDSKMSFEEMKNRIIELSEHGKYKLQEINSKTVIISDPLNWLDFGHFYEISEKNGQYFIKTRSRYFLNLDLYNRGNIKVKRLESYLVKPPNIMTFSKTGT
ncbi:MAG: hypothetical protein Kapaf2KO_24000 [Candidatus Kapaibacteriales bacterium]